MPLYTPAEFDHMTGKQLDAVRAEYDAVGVSPMHWSRMTVADKRRWLVRNLNDFNRYFLEN